MLRQAGLDQVVDQLDLGRGRDEVALDLQAVARPDLDHGDFARSLHELAPNRSSQ